jgi:hypothetical protein
VRNLTASDKSVLIKLASSLPTGDETRRAILAGLKTASGDVNIPGRHVLGNAKVTSIQEAIRKVQALPKRDAGDGTDDGIFGFGRTGRPNSSCMGRWMTCVLRPTRG